MKNLSFRISIFLLLQFSLSSFAQNTAHDSIASKIENASGVQKAEAYYDAVFLYLRGDIPKARFYVTESQKFAQSENDPVINAYAQLIRGIYHSAISALDSATTELEEAKRIGTEEKNNLLLIRAESSLGKTYISLGKPEKGLENLFEALRLLSANPDRESELKVRVNTMWAYLELKRHRDCIHFGLATLKFVEPRFEWMLPFFYNNLAVSYGETNQIDSARYFVEKSIPIAEKYSEFSPLANAYFILGNVYSNSGQYDLAAEQYQKAKPYREKIGDPFFMVADLYTLSDLYYKSGSYRKGVEAGLEGLDLARKHNFVLKFEGVYKALAQNYEGLRDYKSAARYYDLWAVAKDSVYKNANANALAEMQTKYESEKKEQQIALQNLRLAEQRAQLQNTYLIMAGLIIITLLSVVIFLLARNRFLRRQELLKKENEILVQDAYIQATLQSQEKERKRFAQDLHDSMGQLISSLRLVLASKDESTSLEHRVNMVRRSERILDEMHKEIRSVAFNLMPQTLILHGLLPALEEMTYRINQSGGIRLSVSGFELPERLTELQEISLYRVLQEWLNNIIKHSDATKLELQLVKHEDEIVVTAEDNGEGFDVAQLENSKGNGWKNIQSRLKAIKATAEIDTQVGRQGTTFIIRMLLIVVENFATQSLRH